MMNTPIHTPGAFLGGSGVFPPSSAPVYPWMCLPIDQDTMAFGDSVDNAAAAAAGSASASPSAVDIEPVDVEHVDGEHVYVEPIEVDSKPDITGEDPLTLSPPKPEPVSRPTLQLVPSDEPSGSSDAAAPATEAEGDDVVNNNEEKYSPNSEEDLGIPAPPPATPSAAPLKRSGSTTEEDEEGCSSDEDDEGNYHDQVGYYYAPPRNRREPQTAGGTDRSLSAITNCPISISWLKANFEYAPGKSLPRGFVYDQYVVLCEEHTLEPVNAASFGKLIRCVFPGLKTRRLGTRGNSKYHYNGVYLKTDSVLHALLNHVKTQQGLTYDATGKRGRKMKGPKTWHAAGQPKQKVERIMEPQELTPEEYLGQMPNMDRAFVEINLDSNFELLSGVTPENLSTFQFMYHEHCKALVSCFSTIDLKGVRTEWRKFWRFKLSKKKDNDQSEANEMGPSPLSYKTIMSKTTLFKVCTLDATQTYIRTMDLWTYQLILDVLFPCSTDVMPLQMLHALEAFFSTCLRFHVRCLHGYPAALGKTKTQTLLTLIVSWSEHTALNRMVKTVSTSLRHEDSLKAMRSELGRALNFNKLELDLSRVLAPNGYAMVINCILDFKKRLDDTEDQTIGAWLSWVESLVQKLQAEGDRQMQEKERLVRPNTVKFWRMASDKILGAVMRGTAVSSGVFRTLLIFCDSFVTFVNSTYSARMMGYLYQTFYVHDKHFPEKGNGPDGEMSDVEKRFLKRRKKLTTILGDSKPDNGDSNKQTHQNNSPKSETTEAKTVSPTKEKEEESNVEVESEIVTVESPDVEILGLPHELGDAPASADSSENILVIQEIIQDVIKEVKEQKEDRFPTAAELGFTGSPNEDRRVLVTLGVEENEGTQDIILDFDMLFDPITSEFLEDHGVCKSSVRKAY